MIAYFFAFVWGILILLSLIGWGGLINRLFFPEDRVDWGLLAIWGLAFTIFLGGLLNITWMISNTVIVIYLGIGILYWFFAAFQRQNLWIHSIYDNWQWEWME